MSRRVKTPTIRQKKALDNILSGEYTSDRKAMIAAGYKKSRNNTTDTLMNTQGAQIYLREFEGKALKRFGATLDSKSQDIYLDAMEATKGTGDKKEIDHKMRKDTVDTISRLKGYMKKDEKVEKKEYNFFMFNKNDRDRFNKDFVKKLRSTD